MVLVRTRFQPLGAVPSHRITCRCPHPPAGDGAYVLYWMTANRRSSWNFALERALHWAAELKRPLLVFEALRLDYPWASARLHRFVIDGMADQARDFAQAGIRYLPYIEPSPGAARGLLAALAREACVVIGDDAPVSFLPRMMAAAAVGMPVRFETVDSNGLLPLSLIATPPPSAHVFRRFLQRTLPPLLGAFPHPAPLAQVALPPLRRLPAGLSRQWPAAAQGLLAGVPTALAGLAIDHSVQPGALRGGSLAGGRVLSRFLAQCLERYAESRNDIDDGAASGLSPYLHFGHLSAHQAVAGVLTRAAWSPSALSASTSGSRSGWWGVDPSSEAFLDQLVTWRELGYAFAQLRPDHETYESLPAWARATMDTHAGDRRAFCYDLPAFAAGATHDPLWNAAQAQLRRDGVMHNYLRMLWGKKILEWSASPRHALAIMSELNNRYALDGRDPNSSSGISWCLGRFDRPWAPERPIFGRIRYMSSDSTRRKLHLASYLARYAP